MNKAIRKSLSILAVSAAAGFVSHAAQAQESNSVYLGVGTDGIGAGYGRGINQYLGVRGEVSGFGLSHNFSGDDLNYNANLRLIHGAAFADFFPIPHAYVPLHLTAGLLVGGDQLSGDAVPEAGGTYTINGTTVVAPPGETISAKLKWPTVRPYLGIGIGHNPVAKKGFSAAFDIGVAFGKPSVDFNVPSDIAAEAGAANVAAEEQKLQSKARDLQYYPIAKLSLTYRF